MIFRRYCSSRTTWIRPAALLALSLALPGCSTFNASPDKSQEVSTGQVASPTGERTSNRPRVSQFEWAVQSYEAGDYTRAIKQFRQLEKGGAKVTDFDLVPYYLGMSYFNTGSNSDAEAYLEKFLQVGQARRESQDARMALMLIYERLSQWPKALGLAAESENLTLFQNNRALLKLIWARALILSGESLGARTQLKEATQYLDLAAGEDRSVLGETERDIWGRYHFISILIKENECSALSPQRVGSKNKARNLYPNWLEGSVDCLRQAIQEASSEIFLKESAWSAPAAASLDRNVEGLAGKIRGFLTAESKVLKNRQALQRSAESQLYRLISELDKNIKIFKNQEVNAQHLESIRKSVDHLLVSLSRPS